jgi:hypothetical protein
MTKPAGAQPAQTLAGHDAVHMGLIGEVGALRDFRQRDIAVFKENDAPSTQQRITNR